MQLLAFLLMLYSGINLAIIWALVGLRKARRRYHWGYDIDIWVVMFVSATIYLIIEGL